MLSLDDVLSFIRMKGPVLPIDVAKHIGRDTLTASATLSELSSKGKIRISHLKVGGSPLYYLPEHERRLDAFKGKLNEKDQRTFDLLKEKGVIRDKGQEPLLRVSLRNIKDFARPIQVSLGGQEELFWKFHSLSTLDATARVREILNLTAPPPVQPSRHPEPGRPEPQPAPWPESPEQDVGQQARQEPTERRDPPQKQQKRSALPAQKQKERRQEASRQDLSFIDRTGDDPFLRQVRDYFRKNEVVIRDLKVVRKNADIEATVDVPSPIGMLTYFCKAKNKKKSNDGDLSSAYLVGQTKKLPVLYLTTGELTGKANQMLATEFRGLAYKRL
ncbi:hypothetical protein JXB02_03635 [Candidatus Woesearchaeota archaeon]|nr:hypothetical protein [Candidatus Woesearchaeota archaeon]